MGLNNGNNFHREDKNLKNISLKIIKNIKSLEIHRPWDKNPKIITIF